MAHFCPNSLWRPCWSEGGNSVISEHNLTFPARQHNTTTCSSTKPALVMDSLSVLPLQHSHPNSDTTVLPKSLREFCCHQTSPVIVCVRWERGQVILPPLSFQLCPTWAIFLAVSFVPHLSCVPSIWCHSHCCRSGSIPSFSVLRKHSEQPTWEQGEFLAPQLLQITKKVWKKPVKVYESNPWAALTSFPTALRCLSRGKGCPTYSSFPK